ncbi:hypothetical protein BCR42DRAFT_413830 [Absidia repens]|uniref:Myb-like domain-containing protein n=1 Tax=Absidia repens TaxID=90262 RepID=A0A1X2II31_9FUNG|nr:hypothetical protein BCR42DRAFT_413830 [Absidia repens]
MLQDKSFNRMSIEHILCSPCDENFNNNDSTYYGLPSPMSFYHSSDDDDDDDDGDDYRPESKEYSPVIFPSHTLCHQRCYSDNSNNMHQLHRRAILPYRRRRTHSSNSDTDSIPSGQTRIPWSPDEDILLKQGYEQGLSWALIASTYLPHRSRGCCWGRFKTLKNKKFLNVQRQIRAKAKPWKTLNPLDMQQYL